MLSYITTGAQTVTGTGPVTGSLDTSALGATADFTVKLDVTSMTAGAVAIIAIEDTANATPFSDAVQVAVFHVSGPIVTRADDNLNKRRYEIPGTRFGQSNSKLRANVLSLSGTSPSMTFTALLQQ
jgi:hypothetical protein